VIVIWWHNQAHMAKFIFFKTYQRTSLGQLLLQPHIVIRRGKLVKLSTQQCNRRLFNISEVDYWWGLLFVFVEVYFWPKVILLKFFWQCHLSEMFNTSKWSASREMAEVWFHSFLRNSFGVVVGNQSKAKICNSCYFVKAWWYMAINLGRGHYFRT